MSTRFANSMAPRSLVLAELSKSPGDPVTPTRLHTVGTIMASELVGHRS